MKLKYMSLLLMIMFNNADIKAQNQDYVFMVESAIKAPSGHNTQPWLFKIGKDNIQIHPNFDKSLGIVDSDNRELFISLGCATENICIAATEKGYSSTVSILANGIISIDLSGANTVNNNNLLFEQIEKRQTNRSVYNSRTIPSDTINLLSHTKLNDSTNMYFFKNGTVTYDTITQYILKGNSIQMSDKAFVSELKSWMRYNKRHSKKNNDGLSYAVYRAPSLPLFISKPIMGGYLNAKTQNKGDLKKIKSSSHFVLFTTQSNTIEEWVNLGRSLQRFLLTATKYEIAHAYLNQPCEVKELSKQLQQSINIQDEHIAIILRLGYAKVQPYSLRKSIDEVIIE